ncbi:hypothetical protein [Pseudanabaena yagii]|uniref:Yip1 domain-containing protein n=1 Tax=Pseudanabaena yagii GIHE-NHR1 TaxID=2722753 RepID=A0ABX1LYM1_9CYAN|nr:hypothetical protein [Pseudanabaena yagii]NMF58977.1 hypothetical protein [Pseudanabaena yagii GIHE-NHR1]
MQGTIIKFNIETQRGFIRDSFGKVYQFNAYNYYGLLPITVGMSVDFEVGKNPFYVRSISMVLPSRYIKLESDRKYDLDMDRYYKLKSSNDDFDEFIENINNFDFIDDYSSPDNQSYKEIKYKYFQQSKLKIRINTLIQVGISFCILFVVSVCLAINKILSSYLNRLNQLLIESNADEFSTSQFVIPFTMQCQLFIFVSTSVICSIYTLYMIQKQIAGKGSLKNVTLVVGVCLFPMTILCFFVFSYFAF